MLWRGQDPVAFSAIFSALADAAIPYREAQSRDYAACLSQPLALSFYGLPHWQILVHPSDLERSATIVEDALSPIPAGPVELDSEEMGTTGIRVEARHRRYVGKRRRRFASGRQRTLRRDIISAIVLLENDVPCWTISGSSGEIRLLVQREDEARARDILGGALRSEGAA